MTLSRSQREASQPAPDEPPRSKEAAVRVVGIGASAGGLEAYIELVRALPPDTHLAFVLVPHLSPSHHSEIPTILSGHTVLPVTEAVDDEVVEPDHVYAVPANCTIAIGDRRLHLDHRPPHEGGPTIIDGFLQSLAEEQGPGAIGVVLSGTGHDGTAGLRAIKAGGGTTLVQDPTTATHAGMPESALEAGCVDYSLPPAAIARSLAALAAGPVLDSGEGPEATPGSEEERATAPQREAEAELETGAFDAIADLLQNATGVRFRDYKRATISRRVRRRLQELGLQDFPTYLARLREDPAEIRTLFETVLIHFTGFFREPPTFDALRETVLPAVLANRPAGAPVRAWVVACSTGQEAYSAAISLGEGLAALGRDVPLQIFATDLSESALAVARTGRYPESIAGEVSPERLSRFFVPVDGGHRVKDQVREMCVFARHDVTRDPPFSHQDLVLCRNLLIYLNPDLQRRVLHNLHYALKPTGFLALGSSERAGRVDELFEPVDRSHRIYARRPAPTHVFMDLARASGRQSRPLPEPAGAPLPPVAPSETEIQRIAEHTLFTSYPGASVIVGPDLGIVHVQGQARPYLEVPTGGPTAQLLRMAHPDLRSALGRLLRKARKDQAPARRANLPIETGGRVGHVNLTVLPLPAGAGSPGHCLVVFDPVRVRGRAGTTEEAETSAGAGDQAGGDTGLADVRQELAETKEYLESVIGQQASTHAELEEAYQSLLSSNEEFQSTNEELETTKEELQSLNEELTTLNEELHQRNAELTARAAEIAGLLESMTMPVVMLTADLRVRAFNAPAAAELRLGPASLGRRLQQAQLPVVFPLLLELAERALRDGTQQEREVQSSQGKWHALRTWPILGPAGDAPSVVFALVDITSLKTRLALTEEARAYSSAIVETVVEPLVVLDQELRMLTANRAFHRAFGASPEAIRGISLFQLGSGEWDRPELRKLLDEVRLTGTAFEGYETTLQSEGNARVFWLNARLISEPGSDLKNVLLALEDITQRKLLEGRLAETARMRALGQLAGGVAHEINNQMTAVLGFAGFLLRSPGVGEAQRSELQLIIKAAQRSADITRQLLAFSRRETLRPIVLDLNAIVAASETLLHRALGPDIELDISLGPLVGQVRVDQAGLEQALVNLAINARDAMPGGGRLTVETTTVTVSDHAAELEGVAVPIGTYARLIVTDTGTGMDAATRARIFEPFFTTKDVGEGTGLGLASIYGTVKQSGGFIWVESEPGQGTSFTIDLPQIIVSVGPARPAAPAPSEAAPRGSGVILVVEDDEVVRMLTARLLRELGYTALEAASGEEALRLVGDPPSAVQLVLSDVIMPGMSGTKLRSRLAESHPGLPVLFMSGFAAHQLVRRGDIDSVTAVLQKPFDGPALAHRVRQELVARGMSA